jgi:hypothetical protein
MSDVNQDVDFKVDLSKPPVKEEEAKVQEPETTEAEPQKEEVADVKEENTVDQNEEAVVEEQQPESTETEPKEEKPQELTKEDIINDYLTDRYQINAKELEDVLSNNEEVLDLPEEVEKYLQYKEQTNRGLRDFVKANEDVSEYEDQSVLREYYMQTNPELDDNDISYLINEKYEVDENVDTESDRKRKSLEKKQELHRAKEYFNNMQERYRAPLESSMDAFPDDVKKAVEFYQQYNDEAANQEKLSNEQRKIFEQKTSSFFNDKFKGFEYNLGEKTVTYKPKSVTEVAEKQSDLNNFIQRFVDEKGFLKDANKYHQSLHMAMNPEAYAKFFYEQGKADAVNEVVKDGKNIDMNVRTNVDSSKPGTKFKVVDSSQGFGSGLKIKKR